MKLRIDGGDIVFTDYGGKTICALLTEDGLILSTPRFDIEWNDFRGGVATLMIPFTDSEERKGLDE